MCSFRLIRPKSNATVVVVFPCEPPSSIPMPA
jgi:hypothetical protein